MLITVENLKEIYIDKDFSKFSNTRLKMKLESIESTIRGYTKNNFINRNFRTKGSIKLDTIYGDFRYFKKDDTIQLSGINSGIYTVTGVDNSSMSVDSTLIDVDEVIVNKVVYPKDVIDGAIELLDYDVNRRSQANSGIASETISRHSVSYKQYSEANMIEGYPAELMLFLRKYTEWQT